MIRVPETYEIYEEIGAGGGGTVFRAYHKNLRKEVVIKKLHDEITNEKMQRAEVDILKNLHHPFLPQVFDYFVIDGAAYTVMDFVEGESLQNMLDRGVVFSEKKAKKYAKQLLEALQYLHSQKIPIIHGDIKPDNIMLTPEDQICLIDFNVSGITNNGRALTYGFSPGYGAPEQYAEFQNIRKTLRIRKTAQAHGQNTDRTELMQRADAERTELLQGVDDERTGFLQRAGDDRTELLQAADNDRTELLQRAGDDHTELLQRAGDDRTELLQRAAADRTELLQRVVDDRTELLQGTAQDRTELLQRADDDRTVSLWDHREETAGQQQPAGEQAKEELGDYDLSEGLVISIRTDIYSVGSTLYHMLSGKRPGVRNVVPIQELVPQLSDGMAFLIGKAMALRPEKRFKNCESMLKLLGQMGKVDRRYKHLSVIEYVLMLLLCLAFAGSMLTIQQGRILMEQEKERDYSSLVSEMAEEKDAGNYEKLEELFHQAVELFPDNSEAYYEMALAFYDQRQYQKCVDFIFVEVFSNSMIDLSMNEDRFDFLSASSYLELEQYSLAAEYYQKALQIRSDDGFYYRDYVIALAKLGKVTEAREILDKARAAGVTKDILYLLEGEVCSMEKDFATAENSLKECIASSDNSDTLVRAYSKLDEVYEEIMEGEELYNARIPLLTEAVERVSKEDAIVLMERLAQAYIDRADLTDNREDDEHAIEVFEQIRSMGYGTFQTDYNLAVLYEKTGQVDKAIEWIQNVLADRGDDYRWYKRLAFLELQRQNGIENTERDYLEFKMYYDMMLNLYEESGSASGDMEIQVLEQLYNDLVDQNWLE